MAVGALIYVKHSKAAERVTAAAKPLDLLCGTHAQNRVVASATRNIAGRKSTITAII
jgi:hypothetical protein